MKKIIFFIILMHPLITIIDSIISIGNLIQLMLAISMIILLIGSKQLKKNWATVITLFLLLFTLGFHYMDNKILFNASFLFYFVNFVLVVLIIQNDEFTKNLHFFVVKNKKWILLEINLIFLYLWFLFISGQGFKYYENWGMEIFHPYAYNAHIFSYHLIFISVLYVVCQPKRSFYDAILLGSLAIFLFYTGARTPLLAFVFINIIMLELYKKIALYLILVVAALILVSGAIPDNPIIEKNKHTSEEGNFLNSRDDFIESTLEDYLFNTNLLEKIIGKGLDFDTLVVQKKVGQKLWAHNDVTNILVNMGIAGLSIYIYSMSVIYKEMKRRFTKLKSIFFILIFLFLAFFNGFYVYVDMLFLIPIIILLSTNKKTVIGSLHE